MKTTTTRHQRNFVRRIRAEAALSAWTQCRHVLRTLDHDAALDKIDWFIVKLRGEMSEASKHYNRLHAAKDTEAVPCAE